METKEIRIGICSMYKGKLMLTMHGKIENWEVPLLIPHTHASTKKGLNQPRTIWRQFCLNVWRKQVTARKQMRRFYNNFNRAKYKETLLEFESTRFRRVLPKVPKNFGCIQRDNVTWTENIRLIEPYKSTKPDDIPPSNN